jgi:para-aminobenzoate synthetase component I
VNLSQRFQVDFSGSPWEFFQSLFEQNPAPFFAYIQAGDHQIVSTSPERFIQQSGQRVETRPIKGTAPRGKTAQEDATLREKLIRSRKDDAELSMIVDLLRNDLGKVCEGGSVRVAEHKRLEAYHNVYHLVSIVEGKLSSGRDRVDLLRAVFPGGSITGCPKIRAMEIIDELEPVKRGIYSGAVGYLAWNGNMDTAIAIRTAVIKDRTLHIQAGAGIVADSVPELEWKETMNKGRAIFRAVAMAEAGLDKLKEG